jgi:hypothetical protein
MATHKHLPKPWLIEGNPWGTEAKFLAWVRGVLRKGWNTHPIKIMFLREKRVKMKNTDPKSSKRFPEVWGCQCEQCGAMFPQKEIEVDHIEAAGSFRELTDIGPFAERLFLVDFDSIRAVCKGCHKIKSYAERMNFSFEKARAVKKAIDYIKQRTSQEQVAFLASFGYNGASVNTAAKRRKLLEEVFEEDINADTRAV